MCLTSGRCRCVAFPHKHANLHCGPPNLVRRPRRVPHAHREHGQVLPTQRGHASGPCAHAGAAGGRRGACTSRRRGCAARRRGDPPPSSQVSIPARRLPESRVRVHRTRRVGPGVRPHLGGEDRLCRVRHRHGAPGRPARDLLVADQGAVQPEVPRAAAALRRRRPHHGRCHHQRGRELPRHDHRDTAAAGLRRLDTDARGQVGHLRRGAHARQRSARLGHRGDPHPAAAQHALRAALGDAPQRGRGGGVGGGAAQPRVPRRAHRAPADAAAALCACGGRRGALPRAAGGRALRRRRVAGGRGRATHAA